MKTNKKASTLQQPYSYDHPIAKATVEKASDIFYDFLKENDKHPSLIELNKKKIIPRLYLFGGIVYYPFDDGHIPGDVDVIIEHLPEELREYFIQYAKDSLNGFSCSTYQKPHYCAYTAKMENFGVDSNLMSIDWNLLASEKTIADHAKETDITLSTLYFDPRAKVFVKKHPKAMEDVINGVVRPINPDAELWKNEPVLLAVARILSLQREEKPYHFDEAFQDKILSLESDMFDLTKINIDSLFHVLNKLLQPARALENINTIEKLGLLEKTFPQLKRLAEKEDKQDYQKALLLLKIFVRDNFSEKESTDTVEMTRIEEKDKEFFVLLLFSITHFSEIIHEGDATQFTRLMVNWFKGDYSKNPPFLFRKMKIIDNYFEKIKTLVEWLTPERMSMQCAENLENISISTENESLESPKGRIEIKNEALLEGPKEEVETDPAPVKARSLIEIYLDYLEQTGVRNEDLLTIETIEAYASTMDSVLSVEFEQCTLFCCAYFYKNISNWLTSESNELFSRFQESLLAQKKFSLLVIFYETAQKKYAISSKNPKSELFKNGKNGEKAHLDKKIKELTKQAQQYEIVGAMQYADQLIFKGKETKALHVLLNIDKKFSDNRLKMSIVNLLIKRILSLEDIKQIQDILNKLQEPLLSGVKQERDQIRKILQEKKQTIEKREKAQEKKKIAEDLLTQVSQWFQEEKYKDIIDLLDKHGGDLEGEVRLFRIKTINKLSYEQLTLALIDKACRDIEILHKKRLKDQEEPKVIERIRQRETQFRGDNERISTFFKNFSEEKIIEIEDLLLEFERKNSEQYLAIRVNQINSILSLGKAVVLSYLPYIESSIAFLEGVSSELSDHQMSIVQRCKKNTILQDEQKKRAILLNIDKEKNAEKPNFDTIIQDYTILIRKYHDTPVFHLERLKLIIDLSISAFRKLTPDEKVMCDVDFNIIYLNLKAKHASLNYAETFDAVLQYCSWKLAVFVPCVPDFYGRLSSLAPIQWPELDGLLNILNTLPEPPTDQCAGVINQLHVEIEKKKIYLLEFLYCSGSLSFEDKEEVKKLIKKHIDTVLERTTCDVKQQQDKEETIFERKKTNVNSQQLCLSEPLPHYLMVSEYLEQSISAEKEGNIDQAFSYLFEALKATTQKEGIVADMIREKFHLVSVNPDRISDITQYVDKLFSRVIRSTYWESMFIVIKREDKYWFLQNIAGKKDYRVYQLSPDFMFTLAENNFCFPEVSCNEDVSHMIVVLKNHPSFSQYFIKKNLATDWKCDAFQNILSRLSDLIDTNPTFDLKSFLDTHKASAEACEIWISYDLSRQSTNLKKMVLGIHYVLYQCALELGFFRDREEKEQQIQEILPKFKQQALIALHKKDVVRNSETIGKSYIESALALKNYAQFGECYSYDIENFLFLGLQALKTTDHETFLQALSVIQYLKSLLEPLSSEPLRKSYQIEKLIRYTQLLQDTHVLHPAMSALDQEMQQLKLLERQTEENEALTLFHQGNTYFLAYRTNEKDRNSALSPLAKASQLYAKAITLAPEDPEIQRMYYMTSLHRLTEEPDSYQHTLHALHLISEHLDTLHQLYLTPHKRDHFHAHFICHLRVKFVQNFHTQTTQEIAENLNRMFNDILEQCLRDPGTLSASANVIIFFELASLLQQSIDCSKVSQDHRCHYFYATARDYAKYAVYEGEHYQYYGQLAEAAMFFIEKKYDEAIKIYGDLLPLLAGNPYFDPFFVAGEWVKLAIACLKNGQREQTKLLAQKLNKFFPLFTKAFENMDQNFSVLSDLTIVSIRAESLVKAFGSSPGVLGLNNSRQNTPENYDNSNNNRLINRK